MAIAAALLQEELDIPVPSVYDPSADENPFS